MCFSSPLKRTLQTAEIIINGKCDIIYDDLLLERGLGSLEGKNHAEYKKFDYYNYDKNCTLNGVEGIKELLNRTNNFLNKLKTKRSDKTILIVSHSATVRTLHFNIIGYDKKTDFLSFCPKNGEVYEYDI